MQRPLDDAESVSVLAPVGYQCGSCGYCKQSDSSASYYARASRLTPEHYQELADRGWRRSGNVLYKPDLKRHCCPHYTIRLPVSEFKPSRDQRQAVNRWNHFVLGDAYLKEAAKLYPKSKEEKKQARNTFDLVTSIHAAETGVVRTPPTPAHTFTVTLEPSTFTEEKFLLYRQYQIAVHHDDPADVTRSGFRRFLCDSPIPRRTRTIPRRSSDSGSGDNDEEVQQPLGTYHQCYRLDGALIAIGVLDLLPRSVSGVYFLYDPGLDRHRLGALSALREAALARERAYPFYYMGYYIPTCPKMRYKADYRPQHVLHPRRPGTWLPLDDDAVRTAMMNAPQTGRVWGVDVDTGDADGDGGDDGSSKDDLVVERNPKDAARRYADGDASLFDLAIPGVLTRAEVERQVDLDAIRILLPRGLGVVRARDLVAWEDGDITAPHSLKGVVGQFAAVVGPEVAREMVVSFA